MAELLLYTAAKQSPIATILIWLLLAIVIMGLLSLLLWQLKNGRVLKKDLQQLARIKKNNVQNEFVLKAMRIATWHMDVASGRILYDNDFREHYNDWMASNEDVDSSDSGLGMLHEQDSPRVAAALTDLCSGKTEKYHVVYRVRIPNTDRVYWEESYATVSERGVDGTPSVVVGTSKRIDDEKNMEYALVEARNKAEESDRLKTAFLANMSHEIRTPLNAIVGFTSVIPDVEDAGERQSLLDLIHENTQKLLRIIDDVVSISKVESGKELPVMTTFDLAVIIRQVLDEFLPSLQPGVIFNVELAEPTMMITTDMQRVKEVLKHLVQNAVKFTAQGSVTVGFSKPDQGSIRIWVRDTGKGIAKEYLERVFERFFKVDEFIPGAGLGLSISRTMAESLGGTVVCESQLGQGSTFLCTIPLQ